MATTLVLFRTWPAYQALGRTWKRAALLSPTRTFPTAVLRPDGSSVILSMDRARNVKTFDAIAPGDGAAFASEMDALGADAPFLFALLGGSLWSPGIAKALARELWRRGPRNLAEWFGEALAPARGYLETTYRSDAVRALWAPWVLHTGLGPESAYSAAMAKVIAFAVEAAGCPIAVGGAKTLLPRSSGSSSIKAAPCGRARTSCALSLAPAHARAASSCQRRDDHGDQGRGLLDCARATLQRVAQGLAHAGSS